MKNKRGQIILYTLMLATLILLIVLAFAQPVKQFTNDARNNINCTDTSINDFDKVTCYALDINFWLILFIGIGIAFAALGAKVIAQ